MTIDEFNQHGKSLVENAQAVLEDFKHGFSRNPIEALRWPAETLRAAATVDVWANIFGDLAGYPAARAGWSRRLRQRRERSQRRSVGGLASWFHTGESWEMWETTMEEGVERTGTDYECPPLVEMTHKLNVWAQNFDALDRGERTFEVRIDDDRNFAVDDVLHLRGCVRTVTRGIAEYSGRECFRRVTYKLTGHTAIKEGWCVLGLAVDHRSS